MYIPKSKGNLLLFLEKYFIIKPITIFNRITKI